MLQTKDDRLPRQPPFAHHPRSVKQHKTAHQAQYQVAVVRLFAVHLTGAGRQQVLQGPKTVLDPPATLPCPYEPGRTDSGFETHHVELILPVLIDHDERHRAIRRTGGSQPRIAHTRDLGAVTPGPIALMLQVVPLHLAPVWQLENIRAFPFNQEGSLMGGGHMAHELRIAEPAIGHDHRRRQVHAASAECCHASIQHALYPVQFVPARRPRAGGVGPTDSQVDGDDQLALAKDHDQQDPINAGEHPVFLPTPPGAHHAQLIAILFEHRIIRDPGPLPAAARCLAFAGGVTPQRFQHLHAQASKPLEPGALGERTEQAGGQVLVPLSHATQFRVGAAPEQRGTHHSDDFPQELVLAAQAPFDLGHEVFRQPQVIEGLPESLGGVLRLAAVTFKALPRCEAAAVSGFGMFFGASFGWGHGVLRCFVGDFCGCSLPKRTRHMPPRICDRGVTAASGAPRTSCFLWSTMCGIHTPKRPVPFPHRLLYASSASGGWAMTFEEILDQAIAMLLRRGRLTYGTLQRQFQLGDAALATLKDELLYSQPHVVDDAGRGLVWAGATGTTPDGCTWLSRRSIRLRASSVRWRRCGGSSCTKGLSSGRASRSDSSAGTTSWRAASSVTTCPVTLARMVRV